MALVWIPRGEICLNRCQFAAVFCQNNVRRFEIHVFPSFGFCSAETHKCKTKFVFLWRSCVVVFYFSPSRWRYLLNAAGFLVPADAHREVILAKITVLVLVLHCAAQLSSLMVSQNQLLTKSEWELTENQNIWRGKIVHIRNNTPGTCWLIKTSLKLQRKQIQIGFTPSQIQKSHFICVNLCL